MVQAYSEFGLNSPADAVREKKIITEARPTAEGFARLAIYAYQAGQTRKGDLARGRALDLAEPDEKEQLKAEIDQVKQAAVASQLQEGQGAATPTPSPKGD